MAVHLFRTPAGLSAGRTPRLAHGCSHVSGVVFTALAYAAYVAVVAAMLVHLTPGTAEIHPPGSDLAEPLDRPVLAGEAAVLTITVDGLDESVDVLCATTTDRAPFERLHVGPEQVLDAFHRWCSPAQPVTGV